MVDGLVFQSQWSRDANHRTGCPSLHHEAVTTNAPDPHLFFPAHEKDTVGTRRMRLMALSWSTNPLKGGHVYTWLDQHLDFSRFEMTFIGKCDLKFRNIRCIPPLASDALGEELRRHDVFVFPSQVEACSNALLEALHCGLPVIAFNATGNPEVVGSRGQLFTRPEEIPALLDTIRTNYKTYRHALRTLPTLDDVANDYIRFGAELAAAARGGVTGCPVLRRMRLSMLGLYLRHTGTNGLRPAAKAVFRRPLLACSCDKALLQA